MNARNRILAATVDVAARQGFGRASVAAVTDAAGVSRALFYAHFEDRDDAFAAAERHVAEEAARVAEAALAEEGEPCAALLRALLRFAIERRPQAQLLFCESLAAGADARSRRSALIERIAALIDQRWAQAPGAPHGPDLPALALVGAIFRLLATRLRVDPDALPQLLDGLQAWLASYTPSRGAYRWRAHDGIAAPRRRRTPTVPRALPAATGVREPQSREQSRVEQRRRILEGLALAAYEQGFAELTVIDVVAAANVPRSAFYRHFEDLQDAGRNALELSFDLAMATAARTFFTQESWRERLWRMTCIVGEHCSAYPALAHLSFVELHAIGPSLERAYQRMLAPTLLYEDGYKQSERAAKLPRVSTEAILMAGFELAYREAPRRDARHLPDLLAQHAYIALAPFLGPEQATELIAAKLAERERLR